MENKNGQGIFYGVIGVATLVVAIIGATFAYFSASASTNAGDIAGGTLGGSSGVLGLEVDRVTFTGTSATSPDLVPTNISTSALITNAINNKCESTADGTGTGTKYTGCHLYTIHATSDSAVKGATLTLSTLTTTNSTNAAKWHYALFTATESSGTYSGVTLLDSTPKAFNAFSSTALISNRDLTAGTDETFYLLVYVENTESVQNAGDGNDVTGTYSGSVTFTTSEGSTVKATFSAS